MIIFLYIASARFWAISALRAPHTDFNDLIKKIDQVIKPDDKIFASTTYWFGLSDHDYLSAQFYCRFSKRPDLKEKFGENFKEFIKKNKINIIIVDSSFKAKMHASPESYIYFESPIDVAEFINKYTKEELRVFNSDYSSKIIRSPIIVYRVKN